MTSFYQLFNGALIKSKLICVILFAECKEKPKTEEKCLVSKKANEICTTTWTYNPKKNKCESSKKCELKKVGMQQSL